MVFYELHFYKEGNYITKMEIYNWVMLKIKQIAIKKQMMMIF